MLSEHESLYKGKDRGTQFKPPYGTLPTEREGKTFTREDYYIDWNPSEHEITVGFLDAYGKRAKLTWKDELVAVVRYRKVGDEQWSLGFVTPLHHVQIYDAEPGVEYDMSLTLMVSGEEVDKAILRMVGPTKE